VLHSPSRVSALGTNEQLSSQDYSGKNFFSLQNGLVFVSCMLLVLLSRMTWEKYKSLRARAQVLPPRPSVVVLVACRSHVKTHLLNRYCGYLSDIASLLFPIPDLFVSV
jgi:hypothetical protein